MKYNEAVLIVLVILLVVVVFSQGQNRWRGGCPPGCGCGRCRGGCPPGCDCARCRGSCPPGCDCARCRGSCPPGCDCARCRGSCPPGCDCARCRRGFDSGGLTTPYGPLNIQAGALTGVRNDGYNQEHPYIGADLAKNYRNWATKPNDIAEAQRAAWFEATAPGSNSDSFDPTKGGYAADEIASYHTPGASINYQDALVDLVADERLRANHQQWYSEVAPFSQTSMKVDDMDEAVAMSTVPRHGITAFRFQGGPTQHNPLFVTDLDSEQLAAQFKRFDFNG